MNSYRNYMDGVKLSDAQHKRLMDALHAREKRHLAPGKAAGLLGLAASLALVFVLGGRLLPALDRADPGKGNLSGPENESHIWQQTADDPEGNAVNWPCVFALNFADATNAGEVGFDIGLPAGHFTEPLSQSDIAALLGSGEEISYLLGWQGYTVTGRVIYDGEGEVFWVIINGENADGTAFTMTLAPGHIPPTCVVEVPDAGNELNGVAITAYYRYYDSDGDGRKEYDYELTMMPQDVGVRFEAWGEDQNQAMDVATLAANWCAGWSDGLTLEHLVPDEIPEWKNEYWEEEAMAYADELGGYLPVHLPEGFRFGGASRDLGQGRDTLSAYWSRGLREISVVVSRPDVLPQTMDTGRPELYDVRLYPIPWADSVPQEAWDAGFDDPVFAQADLDSDLLAARMYTVEDAGGADGYRFRFSVLQQDGAVVSYDCKGLTAAEVQALILGG